MARIRWPLAMAMVALFSATATAAPPKVTLTDVLQTMQAVSRLQDDEVLAPLNIGVKVRGRRAVLWGPVPTPELALRAEQRLRQMIELIEVRNELIVMPEDLRDFRVPPAPPPLFLPEQTPPPLPDAPQRFLRLGFPSGDGIAALHPFTISSPPSQYRKSEGGDEIKSNQD